LSFLLDTHVWLWSQELPERLGPKTQKTLLDPTSALYVSTVSSLEIARLVSVGAVCVSGSLNSWVSDTLQSLHCGSIDISHAIALGAYSLPGDFHKDPADRILIATARLLHLVLITADERILAYNDVKSLDART
jgi:PIN domain nuclease of toxin-antitoxin system